MSETHRSKITKKLVDSVNSPPTGEIMVADTELRGFYLRVRSTGAKSYCVLYRPDGGGRAAPRRRFTIAPVGTITPDEARRLASIKLGEVANGGDPAAELAETRRRATEADDFAALARWYERKHLPRLRPKTRSDYAPILARLVKLWGKRPVASLTPDDVRHLIRQETQERGDATARYAFAVASAVFGKAVEGGMLSANPAMTVKAPPRPKSRDRWLRDDEIRLLWTAAADDACGPAFKLALLTGARRSEIGGMRWSEIDMEKAVWEIPASRTKNGESHIIHLGPTSLEILSSLPRIAGWKHVLASRKDVPFVGWQVARGRLHEKMNALAAQEGAEPVEPWRTHDLRRTLASGMAGLGIRLEVVEAILNHRSGISGGLARVYQRHDRADDRRHASQAWDARIRSLVDGMGMSGNVLAMASRA